MECPKCGAAQDAGREECSVCGVVFARWQPRAPRKQTLSTPVEPHDEPPKIPIPFVIVAVFFMIVGGLIWTKHVREARAKGNPDDILNDINNKGATLRRQLQESQEAIHRAQSRAAATATAINTQFPADLDESRMIDLIQSCNYFSDRVSVDIPRKFYANVYAITLQNYPAISMAAAQHLIEFDPPSFNPRTAEGLPNPAQPGPEITVKIAPDAYAKVEVSEDADAYHFGLGRRRIEITTVQTTSESTATATFKWGYEKNDGASLAPEKRDRSGGAELQRTANGWTVVRIWRNYFNGSTGMLCK